MNNQLAVDLQYVELEKYVSRGNRRPRRIIVHAIAEYIDTASRDYHCVDFLRKESLGAHYFVDPRGMILRTGDDESILYHARGHNEESIGIEIMVPGLHTLETFLRAIDQPHWCSSQAFEASAQLCAKLMIEWTISGDRLKRHCDVSLRKRDPGAGFDWLKFRDAVAGYAKQTELMTSSSGV